MSFAYEIGAIENYQESLAQWKAALADRDKTIIEQYETIRQLRERVAYLEQEWANTNDAKLVAKGWNKGGISLIKDLIAENAACPHKHNYTDLEQTRVEHTRRAEVETEKLRSEYKASLNQASK